jgi:hypothetical protein
MPVSPDYDPTSDMSDLTKGADAAGSALLGSDLFGLLKGLQQANGPVMNVAQGLTKNLRFAKRIQN